MNRIIQSESYEEEIVKTVMEGVLEEKREKMAFEERRQIREFELERMRLANITDRTSVSSEDLEGQGVNRRVNLKDLVPKFDPKNADINLFFEIFERQAKKEKVAEERFVSQLIPLLPMEIVEFQLTPVALRDRFESHQRRPGTLWSDLVFDFRSYLDNWLAGMKVDDFVRLKELMLTEQLKKRAPIELVDHFIDSWDEFKEATILAEKLDHFETVKKVRRKQGSTKTSDRKPFDKQPFESSNKLSHFTGKGKAVGSPKKDSCKDEVNQESSHFRRERMRERERQFERKRQIICYYCNEIGHIKPSCPKLRKNSFETVANLNVSSANEDHIERKRQIICYYCNEKGHIKPSCPRLRRNSFETVANLKVNSVNEDPFEKFKVKMDINGIDRVCLRDTGSSIDICARSWIKESDLLGEDVWLKSPFDDVCHCFPLAKIKIKTIRGEIYTKAAKKPDGRVDDPYLLGNRTAELIDSSEQDIQLNNVAVKRRAEKIHATEVGKEIIARGQVDPPLKLVFPSEGKEEKEFEIPPFEGRKETILAKINGSEFEVVHKKCKDLKILWDKARSEVDKKSRIYNEKLFRVTRTRQGEEIKQMCVPLKFRHEISNMSAEEVEGDAEISNLDKQRMKFDYRSLNGVTRAELFPLPNMEEIVEKTRRALYHKYRLLIGTRFVGLPQGKSTIRTVFQPSL
ncbi:retrovirus-related Pol polyprotein from transposon 412 [Nephila pilipes]|uniref:Retrovirus-related Pol polyprotein from transposon 412 n=1 Tax=Nephila pilipes TaxID=299642 RepID=A0A8X6QXY7_NEPPI|nr:retrovirus-related Pol polyprotein from transposon 412 [Nephila pilipes]